MSGFKAEAFQPPVNRQIRPEFRRPFSDGSMTVPTSDLAASLVQTPFIAPYYQPFPQPPPPQHAFSSPPDPIYEVPFPGASGFGKAPRIRHIRKGSMTDVKPLIPRGRSHSANRAQSFNEGRSGLGLQTHIEGERTDSVSPPDYAYGINVPLPNRFVWDSSGSIPSMQSFGTTVDEAILDSPTSPSFQFAPLAAEPDEESKKQRRRECHNQVEKRRREHINAKIEELSLLLPPTYHQMEEAVDEEEEEDHDSPKKKKNRRSSVVKPKDMLHCKGRVLTQSVQYIQDLQRVNGMQATRIQQLEQITATILNTPSISQQTHPAFYEAQGLEPMRPSPEPEAAFVQPTWNQFNPVFQPSPDDYHSSAGSSSESRLPVPPRSETDLHVSMSGMDLDSVFRRDDPVW